MIVTGSAVARHMPILIFISFDGFRHDYLSPTYAPNLFDLSKQGLYEDEHEIINNKMYDPRFNETFKPGVTSSKWWNFRGTTMPIWTANQVVAAKQLGQKRYSGSMMYPGSVTPYDGVLPTHLRDYAKNANYTDNIETVIKWLTDQEQPANFVSMYFDEPDSIAHASGPWGQETLEAVRRVDSAAGYLVKRLRDVGLAQQTNIIFVSDHGMAEVKKIVYLNEVMDTSGFTMYGNSPNWAVFIKPERRNEKSKIFRQLQAASKKNNFRVYKRADIPPELHYSKTVRIGDYFIMANEHFDLFPERPKVPWNATKVWGNHGWKQTNRDMLPLFMAYGPSFRRDYNHIEAFPNIDLFPLMVFLLDLPASSLPNNGSLARIVDVIDANHFETGNGTLRLAFVLLIGVMMLACSGIIFTLCASSRKSARHKPHVDFDDLAPGLNIDLNYYLADDKFEVIKKHRRKKDELVLLLGN